MKLDLEDELFIVEKCSAERLETELRLPKGFVFSLYSENDWSLVIKSFALIEGILTRSICRNLVTIHGDGLYKFVRSLDTLNAKCGKVILAQELGILSKENKKMIVALGEIRNKAAHTQELLGFNFADYLTLLDRNQKRIFIESFFGTNSGIQDDFFSRDKIEFIENHPKEFVFLGFLDLLHGLECSIPDQNWTDALVLIQERIMNDLNSAIAEAMSQNRGDEIDKASEEDEDKT